MPYLIIFAAALTALAESSALKLYNKRHDGGGFLFMSMISMASCLFFLVRYLITDTSKADFTPEVIPIALISGAIYCSASFLTFLAIRYGSFAISMLILSYSIVITSGYGIIFLGETAGVLTYVSFAMILVSLFLVRGKKDEDGEKKEKKTLKWIVCIGLSVVGSGLYGVTLRAQQVRFNNTVSNEFMIIALGFSALTLFTIGAVQSRGGIFKALKSGSPYALVAGTANGMTNTLSLTLNTMMPLSISAPTRSIVGTAVTFTFAFIVLKEKFLKRQLVGVVLGAAAVVMLNIA